MTKPRKGKPDSPSHATLPHSGLTMESLYDLMTEHFTKLEEKVATKDYINGLMEIINDQKQKNKHDGRQDCRYGESYIAAACGE